MTAADKQRRRRTAAAPASTPSSAAPAARLIRKYGNRRLYDTHTSRYVTLGDLLEVFAGAQDVSVVDAVSGEDLTKRVLSQAILFEEGRRGTQIIPTPLLRALLRLRAEVSREVYERKLQKLLAEVAVPMGPAGKSSGKPVDGAEGPAPRELEELRRRLKAIESHMGRRK